jgi:hypothetical protein
MIQRIPALFSAIVVLCGTVWAAENCPNVILIMTDDQGYGDLGRRTSRRQTLRRPFRLPRASRLKYS